MKYTIVIVLYNQKIDECNTVRTLRNLDFSKESIKDIELIIYDNSSTKQSPSSLSDFDWQFSYIHDPRNLGIATAYNYALEVANQNGSEWLLLFDHDTKVTQEFCDSIFNLNKIDQDIVSVVPKIVSNQVMISPVFSDTLRPLYTQRPKEGIQERPVMAINSASLLRVSFLNEIGGFSTEFPLDYLDHWIYHEINSKGYKILLLSEELEHELSVLDYSNVSLKRYKSILDSEISFYKKYKNELFRAYRNQLLKRFAKQIVLVKDKKIAFYTLRQIFNTRKG